MTKEVRLQARKLVPEAILKQIISLNSLDMELYDHAKKIFTQEHLMLKAQQTVVGPHRQLAEQNVCLNSFFCYVVHFSLTSFPARIQTLNYLCWTMGELRSVPWLSMLTVACSFVKSIYYLDNS